MTRGAARTGGSHSIRDAEPSAATSSSILRARIRQTAAAPLLAAGGGTPLEALSAQRAGYDAFYLSGYAVAAWRHGLPDIGLLGARETLDALTAVRRVTDLPIICDADTGYGDVIAVTANVRALEAAGASAIQIEDQVWPKRCGHMSGKEVIPADDAVRKVRAALAARRDPDTVIIARTDALAPLGADEAIHRGQLFADAGADLVFVDAPSSVEQMEEIAKAVPGVLVANMSEGGRTPAQPLTDLHANGYGVVLYPTSMLRIASQAFEAFLGDLAVDGSSQAWLDRMHGLDDLNEVVGLGTHLAVDEQFS